MSRKTKTQVRLSFPEEAKSINILSCMPTVLVYMIIMTITSSRAFSRCNFGASRSRENIRKNRILVSDAGNVILSKLRVGLEATRCGIFLEVNFGQGRCNWCWRGRIFNGWCAAKGRLSLKSSDTLAKILYRIAVSSRCLVCTSPVQPTLDIKCATLRKRT